MKNEQVGIYVLGPAKDHCDDVIGSFGTTAICASQGDDYASTHWPVVVKAKAAVSREELATQLRDLAGSVENGGLFIEVEPDQRHPQDVLVTGSFRTGLAPEPTEKSEAMTDLHDDASDIPALIRHQIKTADYLPDAAAKVAHCLIDWGISPNAAQDAWALFYEECDRQGYQQGHRSDEPKQNEAALPSGASDDNVKTQLRTSMHRHWQAGKRPPEFQDAVRADCPDATLALFDQIADEVWWPRDEPQEHWPENANLCEGGEIGTLTFLLPDGRQEIIPNVAYGAFTYTRTPGERKNRSARR